MAGTPNSTNIAHRTVQYDLSGIDDPTIYATEASPGTTYRLLRDQAPKFYIKLDEGKTINWLDITGGAATGINLGIGKQVLKNVVGTQFQFRTLLAGAGISITQNANELLIENTNSGVEVCNPVTLITLSAAYQTIFTYSIPAFTSSRVRFNVVARRDDGTEHAFFDRVGGFYREGASSSTSVLNWHTQTTIRSAAPFDVKYVLSGAAVQLQVRSNTADKCYWKGQVCTLELSTLP